MRPCVRHVSTRRQLQQVAGRWRWALCTGQVAGDAFWLYIGVHRGTVALLRPSGVGRAACSGNADVLTERSH